MSILQPIDTNIASDCEIKRNFPPFLDHADSIRHVLVDGEVFHFTVRRYSSLHSGSLFIGECVEVKISAVDRTERLLRAKIEDNIRKHNIDNCSL